MTGHNTIYDYMAARFRAAEVQSMPLDELLEYAEQEGYAEIWEVPRAPITSAMRVRGLDVKNGVVSLPTNGVDFFDPVMTDYREFQDACVRVMKEAEHPLSPPDLIARTGLSDAAVPLSTMQHYLRRVGIHFLPGVGYWKYPQYTDDTGRIVTRRIKSERIEALIDYFQHQGWPIAGKEAERQTKGLVTSRFLVRNAVASSGKLVSGIGSGLYVPLDRAKDGPIPMSRNIAEALLSLSPDHIIDDKDHLRLFRIALMLERQGLASLKRSRTNRDRVRRQTIRLTLKDAGRAMLEKIARKQADEF